jgi:hypothetical protein
MCRYATTDVIFHSITALGLYDLNLHTACVRHMCIPRVYTMCVRYVCMSMFSNQTLTNCVHMELTV